MENITLKDLKTGDIMLFTAPPGLLSQVIAALTKSTVSHAGMVDYNPVYVINETDKGAVSTILNPPNDRPIYIRRLKNAPDTEKVADIALEYVKEDLPYPFANLAFLGIYMLASDFIPDTFGGEIVKNIIKLACYELIKLFNSKRIPAPRVPMVCSQFVATCYDDAAIKYGPEYKIHYSEDVKTISSLLQKILEQLEAEPDKTFLLKEPSETPFLPASNADPAEEECRRLLDHMKQKQNTLLAAPSKIPDDVIAVFYQYAVLFLRFLKPDQNNLKLGGQISAGEIKNVRNELRRFQETFITPADLLSHTTNLEDVGILTYTQDELDSYRKK